MASHQVNELSALKARVRQLEAERVRYVDVPVFDVDPGTSTFAVEVAGQVDGDTTPLGGIPAPPQFLPAVGDTARLAFAGPQPVYQPGSVAENAITGREIAPGSVSEESLTFSLADIGGTTIWYGPDDPRNDPANTVLVGDLWVQKTTTSADGEQQHQTLRWNGAVWELLADQKVTKALLDAAAAQQAAEAANQKGIDALAAAATAQSTADVKTRTFQQVSAPTSTGRAVGDEWIDIDDGNRRYVWNGNAWASVPIGAPGLNVTARQLGAITTYRQASPPTTGMLVGDYWQDSDDGNKLYRYEGTTPSWVTVQDAAIQTAISNAATAQSTADGKMRIFPQTSAPTGLGAGDVGDMWIDIDDSNRPYTWSGTAWTSRRLGNNAIEPQSLVASSVIATGTVTAALLEAIMVLATTFIARAANGDETRLTPTMLAFFAKDPFDGGLDEVARFGRNSGGRDPSTGRATWNVDNTGAAQYRSVSSAEDVRVQGHLLRGELLRGLPDGIQFVSKDIPRLGAMATVETGLYEMAFTAQPGRAYRVMTTEVNVEHTVNGGRYAMALHVTSDGTRPHHGSPIMGWHSGQCPIGNAPWEADTASVKGIYINNTSSSQFVQMLLCLQPWGGGGVNLFRVGNAGFFMWVEDLGLSPGTAQGVGQVNNMTGTVAAPTTTAPREQTVDFLASWTRTWREDGGIQADGYAEQGFWSGKGNARAMIGFPDMTGALAGAQIRRVELYLRNTHWGEGDGGTAIIRTHGWGSLPASYSQNQFPFGFDVPGWPRYQDWWLRCPDDWGPAIQNGSVRGITLGPAPSNALEYYGRFDGSGSAFNKPTIRVVFAK